MIVLKILLSNFLVNKNGWIFCMFFFEYFLSFFIFFLFLMIKIKTFKKIHRKNSDIDLKGASFLMNKMYDDRITLKLISVTSKELS